MRELRILFLIPRLTFGGAERQLVTLAAALHRRGHRVTVATMKAGALDAELRAAGVDAVCLEKRGAFDFVGFIWRWRRLVRRVHPDIVHGYLPSANAYCALSRLFRPAARVVFGMRASNVDAWRYGIRSGIWTSIEMLLSRAAHATIFNSNAGQEWCRKRHYRLGRTIVIPNGIDTARFRPDPEARARLRTRLDLSGEVPVIVMAARFDPLKDFATFFAAARLFDDRAHYALIGAGLDTANPTVLAMAEATPLRGRVHLLGLQTEPERILAGADLCCLSSYSEGWPNVLGEAMACGVPCVATAAGDAALILGDLGIVTPIGDPVALSRGWGDMLQWRVRDAALPARVRARVVAEFGVEQLVERTERFLASLAAVPADSVIEVCGAGDRPS